VTVVAGTKCGIDGCTKRPLTQRFAGYGELLEPEAALELAPVSNLVNSAKNEGAALSVRVAPS